MIIADKILKDAEAQTREIIKNAENEARVIKEKALAEAETKRAEYIKKAESEKDAFTARAVSSAALQAVKLLNQEKNALCEKVFSSAIDKLASLPETGYKELILKMLEPYSGNIIFNERDKRLFNGVLTGQYTILPETRKILGGFIVSQGDVEINNSFEAILKDKKDILFAEMVKILF
jgi:V/A-type H+-transporting ATPase subunit E